MYRKIFKATSKEDMLVELPGEYLNKEIEVIAFQISDDEYQAKKKNAQKAIEYFKTIEIDMSNFKFNREEANER